MTMKIILDGQTYVGAASDASSDEATASEMATGLKEIVSKATDLKMPLVDGSFLVIGQDALRKAVFIISP